MTITSPAFENAQAIPSQFTCDGDDAHPLLNIRDVPESAQSLALIMDDPDSPTGTWVHWTMWNIDPTATQIAEGEVPEGAVEGQTTFDKTGYGGPCPGSGTHRYFFKLYAIDVKLRLSSEADKAALAAALEGHVVAYADLMGTYMRA